MRARHSLASLAVVLLAASAAASGPNLDVTPFFPAPTIRYLTFRGPDPADPIHVGVVESTVRGDETFTTYEIRARPTPEDPYEPYFSIGFSREHATGTIRLRSMVGDPAASFSLMDFDVRMSHGLEFDEAMSGGWKEPPLGPYAAVPEHLTAFSDSPSGTPGGRDVKWQIFTRPVDDFPFLKHAPIDHDLLEDPAFPAGFRYDIHTFVDNDFEASRSSRLSVYLAADVGVVQLRGQNGNRFFDLYLQDIEDPGGGQP